MGRIAVDSESTVVQEGWGVVYTPRRNRDRFPENCVTTYSSAEEAITAADNDRHLYAARLLGPSRSSEGHRLYYLINWL
jgi:hypothetical protein